MICAKFHTIKSTIFDVSDRKKASINFLSWIVLAILLVAFLVFANVTLELSKRAAIENLKTGALKEAQTQANELNSELQKFSLVPIILRENPDVTSALTSGTKASIDKLNFKLKSLAEQTHATYIYAIDKNGRTVASSNFGETDSFVGKDYQYRPYFLRALQDGQSKYYAKGQTTGRAGLFLAGRISNNSEPIGVIVVKVEFDDIAKRWSDPLSTSFVVNKDGIILFSGDKSLEFKTLRVLSEKRQAEIVQARQFGIEPLDIANLNLTHKPFPINNRGENTVIGHVFLSEYDWSLFRLVPINSAVTSAQYKALFIILVTGVTLVSLLLIYRRRLEIEKEKAATTALLKSEVTRQTKELSETNKKLEHEIAQREQVNLRFRSAREELAQANRLGSVGAITASVAHELNQPVAAIRTFAENGKKFLERGNPAQTETNLNSIVSLTERIASISTELRRYARRGTRQIGAVKLEEIFDGVNLLMGQRLKAKGVTLSLDENLGDYPAVHAGRIRLEQVFVNLLINAIDAIETTENPQINISINLDTPMLEIKVSDNGIGIDEAMAAQIYTPFVTSKEHGMGMGLGIAKDILTEFGGSIELIDSELGGATFLIRLKLHE